MRLLNVDSVQTSDAIIITARNENVVIRTEANRVVVENELNVYARAPYYPVCTFA